MIKILNTISKSIIRIKYRSLIFSTNLVDFKKINIKTYFNCSTLLKKIRKIKTKKIDLIFIIEIILINIIIMKLIILKILLNWKKKSKYW